MTHDDVVLKVQTLAPVLHAHHFSNHIGNKNIFNEKDKIYFNTETDIFFNFIEDIECGIYV